MGHPKPRMLANTDESFDSPLDTAKMVLLQEAAAIAAMAENLGQDFEQAVAAIFDLSETGRVIVSGMGKAGFVGMKISATLASIGVPSFFLHPAEAVHGDLGRYTKSDLALIISNSGQTAEVVGVLSHLKRLGCKIISITASKTSALGEHSDVVLELGQLREACPLGLAPTTSTTAMLALGDALAMALFEKLGSTKEKYAFYHPGGALGRSLMKISQLMRSGAEHCIVPQSMSAKDVLHQITITKNRPGCASVVDASGKLVGIFTDGGFRRCLDTGVDFLARPISEVMSSNPKTVSPDDLAQDALRIMSEFQIDQVVVVDEQRLPLGLVDIQDVVALKPR